MVGTGMAELEGAIQLGAVLLGHVASASKEHLLEPRKSGQDNFAGLHSIFSHSIEVGGLTGDPQLGSR